MTKLPLHTANKADDNFKKLAELFPNAVTETLVDGVVTRAIDKDILTQEISAHVVEGNEERYQFTWPDKKKSVLLANAPNYKTLRPCKEESVNFDNTENLYIEGDNLDVLKLLQETYLGKVKMIYIDPPYNTGKDFVYADDFKQSVDEYMDLTDQYDEDGNRLFTNSETNGRYHTDWLNMIYPRLKLAKDLLKDDGVIFISIDDNEVENLKKVCNEIFGAWNFVAEFPRVTKKAGKTTDAIANNHDYILMYTKSEKASYNLQSHNDDGFKYKDEYFEDRGFYKLNQTLDYNSLQYSPSLDYPIEIDSQTLYPGASYEKYQQRKQGNYSRADWAWRWSYELFEFGKRNGFVVIKHYDDYSRIYTKTYQNVKIEKKGGSFQITKFERTKALSSLEFLDNAFSNDNSKKNLTAIFEMNVFDYSKPISLLKFLSRFATSKDDIILDFFSGSATTAHAVMQLNAEDGGNRKFIMVQLPEEIDEKHEAYKAGYHTICDIGKERIRRAGAKILNEKNITTIDIDKTKLMQRKPVETEHGITFDDKYDLKIIPEISEHIAQNLDIGFRVLKCDSTNMKDVYYSPNDVEQTQLDSFTDNIKDDRTPEDLLFQVMLDLGVFLSCKIETEVIDGKNIFVVYQGSETYLIACFDSKVSMDVVTAIAKRKPYYAVFRDSSMASDSLMASFEQIFEAYSKDTIRKVL